MREKNKRIRGFDLIFRRLLGKPYDKKTLLNAIKDLRDSEVISPELYRILERVILKEKKTVRDIMVPRVDMVTIEANATLKQALDLILSSGFTKIPIYDEKNDRIIGVVLLKELIKNLFTNPNKPVRDIAYPSKFFLETTKIIQALEQFQRERFSIAFVISESGQIIGLITIEDILEEIVGEIWEELDKYEPEYEKLPDGSFIFSPKVDMQEVYKILGGEEDEFLPEPQTLGSFIMNNLKRIPREGEKIKIDNFEITILEAEPHRIKKVKVTLRKGDENE